MLKRGVTFIEIVLSLLVFSLILMGAFQMFNTSLDSQVRARRDILAANLGRGLVAEIMSKDFYDPDDPDPLNNPWSLGIDGGETVGDRSTYDDVDDYLGLIENCPKDLSGALMDGSGGTPDYSAFRRRVFMVVYVDEDLVETGGVPSAYKLIEVAVEDISEGEVYSRFVTVKTR